MTSRTIILLFASVGLAFAAPRCPSARPGLARFRTVAWVNTRCRTDASGLVGSQELYVQRGDGAPVVVSRTALGPVPDPGGLCRLFGLNRQGDSSVVAGFYTGISVSPDGSRVVFELNDAFSILEHDRLTDDERGLWMVGADGTDLVKLGPPAGVAVFRQFSDGTFDFGHDRIAFSPDGRYIVYSDLGAAADGGLDAQLWSLRLADRTKTQLTHLARSQVGAELLPLYYVFDFADDTTVGFYTLDYDQPQHPARTAFYSVSVNGKNLRNLSPITGPNGQVIPQFALTGGRPAVEGLFVDGVPENPMGGIDKPRELFIASGKNVLQLTRFNRVDVGNNPPVVSRNAKRIFFSASADPFGCNPTHNCQVFSIDAIGGRLRQLTRFDPGGPSVDGCFFSTDLGCPVRTIAQDRATGTLILDSSCDPLVTNPTGNQLFAVRPDGSGLRQITNARGVVTDTPDVVEVELPGPVTYQ